jgi:hypothetical protein
LRVDGAEPDGNAVMALEGDNKGERVAADVAVSGAVALEEALLLLDGRLLNVSKALAVRMVEPVKLYVLPALRDGEKEIREVNDSELEIETLAVPDSDAFALFVDDAERLATGDEERKGLLLDERLALPETCAERVANEKV